MKHTPFLRLIRTPFLQGFLFLVFLVSAAPHSLAATKYWIGTEGGSFATATNWSIYSGSGSTTAVPISGDVMVFDSGGNTNATITASMTGSSIEIRAGYTKNITLGADVTLTLNALTIGSSSAKVILGTNGKLTLNGNGTPLTGSGTLDTSTNTPNTVEYMGQGTTNITAAGPVASGYSNLTVDPAGFSRNGGFTLNSGERWISSSIRYAINGYMYLGLGRGRIDKIQLSNFTEVASLSTGHGTMGAAFEVDDFGYFADDDNPAHIIKVRLSDFTQVGSALSLGQNGVDAINGVTDGTYGYFGSNTNPGKIVRVLLSDMTLVDTLTLDAGENPQTSVIDTTNGFAYFGTWSSPGKIVKVRLSDFSRVGAITLGAGENNLDRDAAIDTVNGYAYFTTRQGSGLARVVIIRLADFTEITPFFFDTGDGDSSTIVIDISNGIGYFTANNAPGRLFKVQLSDWTRLDKITLKTGENYPWRGNTIDNGYLYLAANASPGKIIRISLGSATPTLATAASQTLTINGNLTIGDGTNATTIAGSTYNPITTVGGHTTINANASFTAPSVMHVAGNWTNRGTFTPNGGTVTLNGTNQTLTGSTIFANLTKTVSSADTLTFAATTLQRITGALTLRGIAGALLHLRSSLSGIQWQIDPQGTRDIQYANVQDSNNTNATAIRAGVGTQDAGNTVEWIFPTTLALGSSANPSFTNSSLTLTVTIAPIGSTGTITFRDGGVLLGTATLSAGNASITVSSLTIGAHSITADYSGDATHAASSASIMQTISDPPPPTGGGSPTRRGSPALATPMLRGAAPEAPITYPSPPLSTITTPPANFTSLPPLLQHTRERLAERIAERIQKMPSIKDMLLRSLERFDARLMRKR